MGLDMILATVLPLFGPVLIDGAKMLFSKITGISTSEPKTFQERLEWERLSIEKLKAMSQLDMVGGTISRWVADLRASFRYIAVGLIVLSFLIYTFLYQWIGVVEVWNVLAQLTGSSTFFIIGDRVYIHLKK